MGPENILIAEIREVMSELEDVQIFLVGGSVRDILLGRPFSDYDFLLEGELFTFANLLGERLKSPVTLNRQLFTASLETQWGSVDFSRARRETYQQPGDLPKVCPASWQDDLARRDFTINTLLLPLTLEGWGEVQDFHGGKKDLQAGLIRILHASSFRDDPTRILRAIRLKNRLGFNWDSETLVCLQRDWSYLKLISPIRRLKEWGLICKEQELTGILGELYSLGGWEAYFGPVPFEPDIIARLSVILQEARQFKMRSWLLGLLIVLTSDPGSLGYIASFWGLSLKEMGSVKETLTVLAAIKQGLYTKKRMMYRDIRKLPLESIFYLHQWQLWTTTCWSDLMGELEKTHMPLGGKDLLNLGLEPGMKLGSLLEQLEERYWEEEFTTHEEGLELARKIMQEENKCSISGI